MNPIATLEFETELVREYSAKGRRVVDYDGVLLEAACYDAAEVKA